MELERSFSFFLGKHLPILFTVLVLTTGCMKESSIYKIRCSNRKCCQRAAQHKQAKHTHLEFSLTYKKSDPSKKELEVQDQKEVKQPKF